MTKDMYDYLRNNRDESFTFAFVPYKNSSMLGSMILILTDISLSQQYSISVNGDIAVINITASLEVN